MLVSGSTGAEGGETVTDPGSRVGTITISKRNAVASLVLVAILTVWVTIVAGRSCVSGVSAPLLTHCQTEEASYKARIAGLEKELQDKTGALTAQVTRLRKQIEQLTQTADGLWRLASQEQSDALTSQAETSFRSFVTKFPDDKRVPEARKRIAQLGKQRQVAELEAKEEELAARLSSVTKDQLTADPKTYRNKLFRRKMCCKAPAQDIDGTFTVSCYWEMEGNNVDYASHIMVSMPANIARRVPEEAPKIDDPGHACNYIVNGTMQFTGLIVLGQPLMKLKKAKFNVAAGDTE